MAIIPAEEKVFMVSKGTNTTYSGSASLKAMQQWYTMQDISDSIDIPTAPYKVFTALLSQSGDSNTNSQSSGAVQKGVTYTFSGIGENEWDFSNVGGPIYPNSGSFIATATATPNSYGNETLEYNTGAPIVTVLENTIGDVYFTYYADGVYKCNSNNLFGDEKTFVIISNPNSAYTGTPGVCDTTVSLDSIDIKTYDSSFINQNDQLYLNSFEIRVYN